MKNKQPTIIKSIGCLLIVYAVGTAILYNFNTAILLNLILGGLFFAYGFFYQQLRPFPWIPKLFFAGLSILLGFMVFLGIYGGLDTATMKEDVVVVLGSGIRGERVSATLAYRLDKAVDYYHKNPNAIIVVTGGQGPQEDIPEAVAMERYLISKGIPQGQILKEAQATSTYENFVYTKEILASYFQKPYTAVFITNGFHIYRASQLANIVGFPTNHLHSDIDIFSVPLHYIRECAAVIKLWIFKK